MESGKVKKVDIRILDAADERQYMMGEDYEVYEKQGIKNGAPTNQMKGPAFKTELATAYPDSRLVVTKETMTAEGMIDIVYELLKDKLNISKITFVSGVNTATEEYQVRKNLIERCPLCGIALDKNGVCPKCGYKKP